MRICTGKSEKGQFCRNCAYYKIDEEHTLGNHIEYMCIAEAKSGFVYWKAKKENDEK